MGGKQDEKKESGEYEGKENGKMSPGFLLWMEVVEVEDSSPAMGIRWWM